MIRLIRYPDSNREVDLFSQLVWVHSIFFSQKPVHNFPGSEGVQWGFREGSVRVQWGLVLCTLSEVSLNPLYIPNKYLTIRRKKNRINRKDSKYSKKNKFFTLNQDFRRNWISTKPFMAIITAQTYIKFTTNYDLNLPLLQWLHSNLK